MSKIYQLFLLIMLHLLTGFQASANAMIEAIELVYEEQEAGTGVYQIKYTVTERYLRIDHADDQGGYIVYDDGLRKIYSVVHQDRSVLVIPEYVYQKPDLAALVDVVYVDVADAPAISGKTVYAYRVTVADKSKEICMDIMLAEGLLPDVSRLFIAYQKILTGQQSRLLKTVPEEYRSTCFLYDQVFNEGDYYKKGLPIREWHSNGKSRLLTSYKKIQVDASLFQYEPDYEKYSLE